MTPFSRRNLLGTAAGLAAILPAAAEQPRELLGQVSGDRVTLPPIANKTEAETPTINLDPVTRRLGVAVVGLGHLALNQILPGFGQAKHVRVTALVSGEADKARAVAAQYGVPERSLYDYASFDRLRDNPDVDIVYIVLPNAMHAEFTIRAAQAGKHVLCEKPMATNPADAQKMIDACHQAGKRLMIAYRLQYEPHHRALIAAVRGGQHGKPRLITAVNAQNNAADGQWRHDKAMAGGGSLPDVGLYCLNAARYITGEEPYEVTAQMTQPKGDPRFREVEDIAAFTMRFPSGVMANCTSGYSMHESRWMRVQAEDAWLGLDPAFGYSGIAMQTGHAIGEASAVDRMQFPPHNQFAREMDHFAVAIRGNLVPHTPGEEGLADQKIIAALYEAAAGGGVVKLPRVDGIDTTRGPPPKEG